MAESDNEQYAHEYEYNDVVMILRGAHKGTVGVIDDFEGLKQLIVYPNGMFNEEGLNPYVVLSHKAVRPATEEEIAAYAAHFQRIREEWARREASKPPDATEH